MHLLITSTEVMMYQFLVPHVKFLTEQGIKVSVACTEVEGHFNEIREALSEVDNQIKVHKVSSTRTPYSLSNFKAFFELKQIIEASEIDMIWTNEPVMGALTRLANFSLGKKKVKLIYFAHGFHFYKGAPIINWIIYYPAEWILSHVTDCIITINKEDFRLAKRSFRSAKVELFPGIGVDVSHYRKINSRASALEGLPHESRIIVSVGELEQRKNHATSIKAFARCNISNAVLLICGVGREEMRLRKLIRQLSLESKVFLLGYRKDISAILEEADIFLFSSYQEGLSKALMEAMAKGCLCVCSRIRGNVDLIDESNGIFFSPHSVEDCAAAISKAINHSSSYSNAIINNVEHIRHFDISIVKHRMEKVIRNINEN